MSPVTPITFLTQRHSAQLKEILLSQVLEDLFSSRVKLQPPMGMVVPQPVELDRMAEVLQEKTPGRELHQLMRVLMTEDPLLDPEYLIEWVNAQNTPLSTLYVHQPTWPIETWRDVRARLSGKVACLVVKHQILPDAQYTSGYYAHCRSLMVRDNNYLFFQVGDPHE